MKPITGEWVEKAEGDFRSAQREQRVRVRPNPDLVCFLCQQCAEKYLKALLVETDTRFSKTHDLLALLKLVLPIAPFLSSFRDKLEPLNDYAVEFRYPSETATR
jgi:HEPN domain-containing protein